VNQFVKEYKPLPRKTLLIPSGPQLQEDLRHLFIILNEPFEDQRVLLVNVTSYRATLKNQDKTCLLLPGEHPFIKTKSIVFYQKAMLQMSQKLIDGVASGKLIQHQPVSDAVFERIVQGLFVSKFTPNYILDFARLRHLDQI
jgi:hypothetical protein